MDQNEVSSSVKPVKKGVWLMLIIVFVLPFSPLLITRRWGWWEAWLYGGIFMLGFIVSRVLAARRHPDIIAERANFIRKDNTKPWDKILAPLVALGSLLIPLTAGLEALNGSLVLFVLPVKLVAILLLLAGFSWGSYALWENRFFSGTVRIQTERGHTVVSSGPYRIMRHPGYFGSLVSFLVSPLILDSLWAFVPAIILIMTLIIRTRLEDQVLQNELEGYSEYAKKVHYRLIPGIW